MSFFLMPELSVWWSGDAAFNGGFLADHGGSLRKNSPVEFIAKLRETVERKHDDYGSDKKGRDLNDRDHKNRGGEHGARCDSLKIAAKAPELCDPEPPADTLPQPDADAALVCANESVATDVLDGDIGADGDALIIAALAGHNQRGMR